MPLRVINAMKKRGKTNKKHDNDIYSLKGYFGSQALITNLHKQLCLVTCLGKWTFDHLYCALTLLGHCNIQILVS